MYLRLERNPHSTENVRMEIPGRVEHGVVILEDGPSLPDGTRVLVSVLKEPARGQTGKRVRLPLVPSARPGSRLLTAERVAGILEKDDLPA
jgi:hypothetical protein